MLNNVIFYLTVVVTIASLSSGLFRKSRNCWENSCPKIFAIRWSNSSGSRIFVFWFCGECTLAHKLFLYEDITVDGPSKETRCMILLSISTSFTRKSSALFPYQPSLHIFAMVLYTCLYFKMLWNPCRPGLTKASIPTSLSLTFWSVRTRLDCRTSSDSSDLLLRSVPESLTDLEKMFPITK